MVLLIGGFIVIILTMLRFIFIKPASALFVMTGVICIVFFLLHLSPGDLVEVTLVDILLAIALAGILSPRINNIIIALIGLGWVEFSRLTRAQTLSIKNHEHIQAAKTLATPTHTTLRKHILPLIMAPVIVETTFGITGVIIAETASWQTMIRDGTRYMLVAPHIIIASGLTLCLVVLSVNMIGDKLRNWMDIKAS